MGLALIGNMAILGGPWPSQARLSSPAIGEVKGEIRAPQVEVGEGVFRVESKREDEGWKEPGSVFSVPT